MASDKRALLTGVAIGAAATAAAACVYSALASRRAAALTPAAASGGAAPAASAAHPPATGKKVFLDPNMPVDAEGRTYHLNTKAGEVAPRILTVGDAGRAERVASLLDAGTAVKHSSSRGFITFTGTFKGVPVSIVTSLMGYPNIDFAVRECRAVVAGPMAVLRFGTCGGAAPDLPAGTVVVCSKGAVIVRRDPDAIGAALAGAGDDAPGAGLGMALLNATPAFPYDVSRVVLPDATLTALYEARLKEEVAAIPADVAAGTAIAAGGGGSGARAGFRVVGGLNASADSFYSAQGRTGAAFEDRNGDLIHRLGALLPDLACLEMETFHLLDLARASRPEHRIAASGAAIILASRVADSTLNKDQMHALEVAGGRAALTALTQFAL